jgi:hypothetical protein
MVRAIPAGMVAMPPLSPTNTRSVKPAPRNPATVDAAIKKNTEKRDAIPMAMEWRVIREKVLRAKKSSLVDLRQSGLDLLKMTLQPLHRREFQ